MGQNMSCFGNVTDQSLRPKLKIVMQNGDLKDLSAAKISAAMGYKPSGPLERDVKKDVKQDSEQNSPPTHKVMDMRQLTHFMLGAEIYNKTVETCLFLHHKNESYLNSLSGVGIYAEFWVNNDIASMTQTSHNIDVQKIYICRAIDCRGAYWKIEQILN